MKRILLAFCTSFILTVTSVSFCFASENNLSSNDKETITVKSNSTFYKDSDGNYYVTQTLNEADLLKIEANKTVQELKQDGYTSDEISEIKKFNSTLDSKEKYGNISYTIKYYKDPFKYSGGITYIKTSTTWSWSKTPIIVKTDLIGMTTSTDFAKYGSSSAHINYYKDGNKTLANKKVVNKTVKTKNSGEGTYIKIRMARTFADSEGVYYGLGGSMTVNWRVSGNIKTVGLGSNYGHTKIKCTPSINFGTTGVSISFSPKNNISYGDEAYINVKR